MATPKHLTKKTVAKVLINQADIKSAGVLHLASELRERVLPVVAAEVLLGRDRYN
jgi:hypothetical protein